MYSQHVRDPLPPSSAIIPERRLGSERFAALPRTLECQPLDGYWRGQLIACVTVGYGRLALVGPGLSRQLATRSARPGPVPKSPASRRGDVLAHHLVSAFTSGRSLRRPAGNSSADRTKPIRRTGACVWAFWSVSLLDDCPTFLRTAPASSGPEPDAHLRVQIVGPQPTVFGLLLGGGLILQ